MSKRKGKETVIEKCERLTKEALLEIAAGSGDAVLSNKNAPRLNAAPYSLDFVLMGLPKSPNALLGAHWTIRSGHAKKWKKGVENAIKILRRPPKPLAKAQVWLERHSSAKSMDEDNLRSSFKPIMDGLVVHGVLLDDSPAVVGRPEVAHHKCPPGKGHIKVRVIEIQDTQT